MKLFNSQSRQVELFKPHTDEVTLYTCGITPYDTTHLGHAFTYAVTDVLVRYLELKGWRVKYVQNVTDIDDDILQKAKDVSENWRTLGNRWTRHFIDDMQALNILAPDYFPKATEVIPQIISSVQALLAADVAYEVAGNVYFRVDAWPEFGRLSQIPRTEMLPVANERGNHPDDPYKKDPLDFVLWQAKKEEAEPAWESPWGDGRPGWHIECSTMASHLLEPTVDIHLGGADLLFPHHECEKAQVEAINESQRPFVRFWLHTAMVKHEGQKMAKSLGNLVLVRDLLQQYSADAIRLYLAQHHYRQPWEHDELLLKKSTQCVEKLKAALTAVSTGDQPINVAPVQKRFTAVMDNDLATSKGVATLLNLADEILFRAPNGYLVDEAQVALQRLASVFGLRLQEESTEERVLAGWNKHSQRFKETT